MGNMAVSREYVKARSREGLIKLAFQPAVVSTMPS
jgi:hypothetical protein